MALSLTDFIREFFLPYRGEGKLVDPYGQICWVRLCCEAIAGAVKSVEGEVADPDTQKPVTAKNGGAWLNDLFDNPNPYQSREDFLEQLVVLKEADGCGYVVFQNGGKPIEAKATPDEMYVQPSSWLEPIADKQGRLLHYKYKPGGEDTGARLEPHQVLRFADTNPRNIWKPMPKYETLRLSLETELSAALYNKKTFENGGSFKNIFTTDEPIDEAQLKAFKRAWMDEHAGAENANKPAFLANGLKLTATANSHADMEYLDGRKWTRQEILSMYRVPPIMVGIYEDANRASAKEQKVIFWENVGLPWIRSITGAFWKRFNVWYRFKIEDIADLQRDKKEQVELVTGLSNMGVPMADALPWAGIDVLQRPWYKRSFIAAGRIDPEAPPPAPMTLALPRAHNAETKIERAERLHEQLILRVFMPGERRLLSFFRKDWLDGIEADVLANLARLTGGKGHRSPRRRLSVHARDIEDIDSVLFDIDEWNAFLAKQTPGHYKFIASLALESVSDEIGPISFGVQDPRWVQFLEKKIIKVKTINQTLHGELRSELLEAMNANETVDQIQARIQERFGLARERARTIARTETAQTTSGTRHTAFEAEGVSKHSWSTSGDEKVRQTHVHLGTLAPVEIGHNYAIDIGKGGTLRHPSDMGGPREEIINCRCVSLAED